ncbi:MAG TPA: hypothetical protein VFW96_07930 [Thermomicrobiales bacterium]|nr:hypothetical protein [Thermomicrobiales bacterium]
MADADDFLRRAAARARREPGLLGALLAGYAARAGLDDDGLAAALGCRPDQLARLALCRPPRPARFRADIEQIAARVGLDPLALTRLLRLAGALDALAWAVPDTEGLRAARRADEPEEEPR